LRYHWLRDVPPHRSIFQSGLIPVIHKEFVMSTFFTSGNLTKKPELRYTPKGTPVCQYTVADNKGGDNTVFLQIKTYGRQAQWDMQFLDKGHCVVIQGDIETWFNQETKQGGVDFVGINVKYLGQRQEREVPSDGDGSGKGSKA
jgi:single-strand DNA-binding protein